MNYIIKNSPLAGVAKLVYAVDSKSTVEIHAGSNPAFGTIFKLVKC